MEKPPIEMLVTLPLEDTMLKKIQQLSPRLNISQFVTRKVEEIPADVLTQTEVLYTDLVIPSVTAAPNLRWIQFHWAGVEFLLDAPQALRTDLQFTTLSGAAAPQMADYIMMMLLALGHHLPDLYANQL